MAFHRERIGQKAAELAASGIFIGTSSWKYQGWLNSFIRPPDMNTVGKLPLHALSVTVYRNTLKFSKLCAWMPRITIFPAGDICISWGVSCAP